MAGAKGVHGKGKHVWWGGACRACRAGEMATAVDGTHPTGMHSCFHAVFGKNLPPHVWEILDPPLIWDARVA